MPVLGADSALAGTATTFPNEPICNLRVPNAEIELFRLAYSSAGGVRLRHEKGGLKLSLSEPFVATTVYFEREGRLVGGKVGPLAYIPRNTIIHGAWQAGTELTLSCQFDEDPLGCLQSWDDRRLMSLLSIRSPLILELMLRINREVETPRPYGRAILEGLCLQLAGEVGRYVASSQDTPNRKRSINALFEAVIRTLEQSLYTITLRQISEQTGYNEDYLSARFRQIFGRSFSSHVSILRNERAKQLLQDENISIKEISYRLGYREPAEFSRSFKRDSGISPSDFRRNGI